MAFYDNGDAMITLKSTMSFMLFHYMNTFFAICVLPTDISDIAVNSNATGQKREKLKEKCSTVLYPHIIA